MADELEATAVQLGRRPGASLVRSFARVKPGDYIVVYQRKGMQYDAAQQRLRWDDHAPVAVELLLVDMGAALFRVR